MQNSGGFLASNKFILQNLVYILVSFVILYAVYRVVYPTKDTREATVLEFNDGNRAASKAVDIDNEPLPKVFTGGELTLSFWMYVSDWDYRAGLMKHVVSVGGKNQTQPGGYSSLVVGLYPTENKMMIRVRTAGKTGGGVSSSSMPTGGGAPFSNMGASSEYTNNEQLRQLMESNAGLKDFLNTVNFPLCDLPEFDLQRWVHTCIVINGRVCDVYLDGKLTRSCMLDNVVQFQKSDIVVDVSKFGGFGGATSRVQLLSYAVTPDRVYGMYQAGPTIKSNTLIDRLLALLGFRLTFSGYKLPTTRTKCDSDTTQVEVPSVVGNFLENTGMTSDSALGQALANPNSLAY